MPAQAVTGGLPDARLVIGGRRVGAADGGVFDVTDPATGSPVASVADATVDDVGAAVDAAWAAFAAWKKTPARDRSRILLAGARLLRDRAGEIARVLTLEQGKPLAEAAGEVEASAGFLEWFAGEAERVYGQIVPQQQADQRILVLQQPVGVTASITPWNFPALMLARKVAPALAAGCTMVVKPASATPLTASALVQCLIDAGVPDGVVGLVPSTHSGEVAGALFGDPRVRKVSFTGSTDVGRELIRQSAGNITRLSLELGGHSPYLVFADADLERSAAQIVASKFRNSGQTCVCANRAYIERSVYQQMIELVKARAEGLTLGSGLEPETTMGPLINESAVAHVDEHVADAVSSGARLITGGRRAKLSGFEEGNFYEPTILADMHRNMLIASEETFGPALAVAPFDTEAEAIQLANDTPYGLAAYLHTRDYGRLIRVAEELEYGIVGVETGVITAPNAPFGGRKESGYGIEGGSSGIDEYLAPKYLLLGDVG